MGVEQAGGRSARRKAGGAVCGGPGVDVPEGQPGSPGLPGHPGAAPGAVLLWLARVGSAYRRVPWDPCCCCCASLQSMRIV